jgi:hypothetical protein
MSIITREFLENQLLKKKRAYPKAFTGVQFMDSALQKAKCPDVNNLFKSVYTACKCSKFHFLIFQLVLVVSCVHHQKKKKISSLGYHLPGIFPLNAFACHQSY